MAKFKTAEEFLSLPEEERIKIANTVVADGDDALDWIEVEEERQLLAKLQQEYKRIEELAYAIGDQILALENEDNEDEIRDALTEFMDAAANECELQYGGDYMDHSDGFFGNPQIVKEK